MAIKKLTAPGKVLSAAECVDEQQEQQHRHVAGIVATLLLLTVVIAVVLYFTFEKPAFPVLYTTGKFDVRAPANAEVLSRAGRGPIRAGEPLAVLLVRNTQDLSFVAEFNRLSEKKLELSRTEAALEREYDQLQATEQSLLAQSTAAAMRRQQCRLLVEQRQAILRAEQQREERSTRLWNLDAMKSTELENVRQVRQVAENELRNAELALTAATTEYDALHRQWQICRDRLARQQQSIRATAAANRAFLDAIQTEFQYIEATPDGLKITVRAPLSGVITTPGPPTGAEIAAGETIATLVRSENGLLTAYLPTDYFNRLTPDAPMIVRLGDRRFETRIHYINPELVNLPKGLRYTIKDPERLFVKVDLAPPPNPGGIPDGLPGRAHFQ